MMRVLFFGRLRESAGCAELTCDAAPATVATLQAWLAARDPALGDALAAPDIRVAVNQTFAARDTPLAENAEVAFMAPLSGG